MTTLMLEEERAHLSHMNAIGEICAQLRSGVLALARRLGAERARAVVERYHRLEPAAAGNAWFPEQLARIDTPGWQQLYVNAEHDGAVGVVTLGREAYNWDVDAELNRAIDWLKAAGIERVILSGDFHVAGQLVGADTSEFFSAFENEGAGYDVSSSWSATARRLNDEFVASIGVIQGKRCLGGMLELMMHCHYLLAVEDASLGLPEVTLPVVPGMEGCHWPYRRTDAAGWSRLADFMLQGRSVRAEDAEGWLIDRAGGLEEVLSTAWALATGDDAGVERRPLALGPLAAIPERAPRPETTGDPGVDAARKAIYDTIVASTGVPLADALEIQSRHSAAFFGSDACRRGLVGTAWAKTMNA
jgi:enoyl-CoA hydratase/carnithine racemase